MPLVSPLSADWSAAVNSNLMGTKIITPKHKLLEKKKPKAAKAVKDSKASKKKSD